MSNKCKSMRLSPLAFGVSLGVITGVLMMILAWSDWMWGYGTGIVSQWATVYPGLAGSLKGGFLGLAWGFLEGFVLGVLWAWVYNMCVCCCRCCACCNPSDKECKVK